MSDLQLSNVSIAYDQDNVVDSMSFHLKDTQIGCLLGPSGCGKTSLLRAIAGFHPIASGEIRLGDRVISSTNVHLPPEQREIGMVFQDLALFPHLSIFDNIVFGMRNASKKEKQQRVDELLELVNLQNHQNRFPHELSGGQQQRIALARAMAPRPRLLLLDEPLGSQDITLREQLAADVREILKQEEMTAILVTHDHLEAFSMTDEIGVLQNGKLQQWDNAYNLYHKPINQFVARFIGHGTLLPGTVIDSQTVITRIGPVLGEIPAKASVNSKVHVLLRPDDIQIVNDAPRKATVTAKQFRGANFQYTLAMADGLEFHAQTPSHQRFKVGDHISFDLDLQHTIILPPEDVHT